MLVIVTQVRIGGKIYEKAQRIIAAIDAMTGELTGDPEYFWGPGAGATEDQRAEAEFEGRARARRPALEAITYFVALPFVGPTTARLSLARRKNFGLPAPLFARRKQWR